MPDQTPAAAAAAPAARAPLLTVDEALDRLLADVAPLAATETIDTAAALGRVVAVPLVSPLDVPAADNAQMDGYAIRAADLAAATAAQPVALPVSMRVAAGHPAGRLAPGTAARIFTGAWIPDGADAVVMQEDATVDGGRVAFAAPPDAGAWVRRRGEDIRDGQTILPAGTRLGPQHLGLAASIGAASMTVSRRPRVALFSTGDELAMPGTVAPADLPPGALYNSNRYTLRGCVEALGCDVVDLGIVGDTLAATRAALVEAAGRADVIVTSGGVSVGEEDHVRPAVEAEGKLALWQIAIKPGKPLAFGRVGSAWFVGLPGNPVSSFVTFAIFVRPLLMRLSGIVDVAPRAYALRAAFDWPKADRRREFLRARVDETGSVGLFAQQGSAVLTSTVWADGLVDNPAGGTIARGDVVRYLPFAALFG